MIRRLLCWLGFHKWETCYKGFTGSLGEIEICKYCGKVKR